MKSMFETRDPQGKTQFFISAEHPHLVYALRDEGAPVMGLKLPIQALLDFADEYRKHNVPDSKEALDEARQRVIEGIFARLTAIEAKLSNVHGRPV